MNRRNFMKAIGLSIGSILINGKTAAMNIIGKTGVLLINLPDSVKVTTDKDISYVTFRWKLPHSINTLCMCDQWERG